MYYYEKVIDGVLHFQTSPNGKWMTSPEWLTAIIQEMKIAQINDIRGVKQKIDQMVAQNEGAAKHFLELSSLALNAAAQQKELPE